MLNKKKEKDKNMIFIKNNGVPPRLDVCLFGYEQCHPYYARLFLSHLLAEHQNTIIAFPAGGLPPFPD